MTKCRLRFTYQFHGELPVCFLIIKMHQGEQEHIILCIGEYLFIQLTLNLKEERQEMRSYVRRGEEEAQRKSSEWNQTLQDYIEEIKKKDRRKIDSLTSPLVFYHLLLHFQTAICAKQAGLMLCV